MIKANELRISNLFNDEDGTPCYFAGVWERVDGLIIRDSAGNTYKDSQIYPIPLSPEILEKCGGEKDDKSVFGGYLFRLNGGEQIRIVYSDTIGWHWPMFGHTAVIVNFLHQFQNLIFLVDGNELDVKL